MADSDGGELGSFVGSSQEGGNKNKRKLPDPSQQNQSSFPSSLTEFPRYEQTSEKTPNPLSSLQLPEGESSQSQESPTGVCESAEWNDPMVRELEELLSSGLRTLFNDAIRQIVEYGYSEDVAWKFIARQTIYCGGEDLVSSIVNGTLATLKKGKKEIDASREEIFEDMQQMVDFTLLEMINVLREIKPFLSITEAMWWLLMCDLNISHACIIDGDLSSFLEGKRVSEGTSSKSDTQSSETVPTNDSEPHFSNPSTSKTQTSQTEKLKLGSFPNLPKPTNPSSQEKLPQERDNLISKAENVEKSVKSLRERMHAMSLTHATAQISGTGRKGRGKKGSLTIRQKSLHGHTEKTYKNYGKGAAKSGQPANIGSFAVEQRVKPSFELPVGQSKGDSTKASVEPKVVASTAEKGHSTSKSSSALSTKGVESALPKPNSKLIVSSSSEKVHASKAETSISVSPKMPDYYAGIPFDESLGRYVPRNLKDELILKLAPRVHELQNEVNDWTEWANEKVMQATRKLSKDLPELKALRKEKQEAEQCNKDEQIVEENTMKRLFEMESALNNANDHIKKSNSTIHGLDVERSTLKKQMEDARSHAAKSAVSCKEAFEREQKAIKKVQSIDGQRELLQEEIQTNKQKTAELQQEITKARNQYNQIEARFNWERMEKESFLAQAAAIKKEREQLEVAAKAEENKIILRAENEKKKYLVNIKKIESQLSLMKYKADSAKIAALRRSLDGGFGGLTPGSSSGAPPVTGMQISGSSGKGTNLPKDAATGALRQDRECVMCLEEEKSVVFLPCAHQVLCPKCNELHEKRGTNECPSCRSTIQRRINVRFPPRP